MKSKWHIFKCGDKWCSCKLAGIIIIMYETDSFAEMVELLNL